MIGLSRSDLSVRWRVCSCCAYTAARAGFGYLRPSTRPEERSLEQALLSLTVNRVFGLSTCDQSMVPYDNGQRIGPRGLASKYLVAPLVDDTFNDRERRKCSGPTRVKRQLRHDFQRPRPGQPVVYRPVHVEGQLCELHCCNHSTDRHETLISRREGKN